jgi:tetratricopeptide (TPR) repeat protein
VSEHLERAFELDSGGDEHGAVVEYERALEAGVPDELLAKALLGYGSTLRNVGRNDDSVRVLSEAVERFPENDALHVFLSFSLWTAGRRGEALARLARRAGDGTGYERSIGGYADEIAGGDGQEYARGMHTIELTDEELRLLRNALHSFLEDFGHDEADVLRSIKQLLAKLPEPS